MFSTGMFHPAWFICQIEFFEAEVLEFPQTRHAGPLQVHVVILFQIIRARDFIVPLQQQARNVRANKYGSTADETLNLRLH